MSALHSMLGDSFLRQGRLASSCALRSGPRAVPRLCGARRRRAAAPVLCAFHAAKLASLAAPARSGRCARREGSAAGDRRVGAGAAGSAGVAAWSLRAPSWLQRLQEFWHYYNEVRSTRCRARLCHQRSCRALMRSTRPQARYACPPQIITRAVLTVGMLCIIRCGSFIPLPGIDLSQLPSNSLDTAGTSLAHNP
jgi:hypothetical protein